MRFVIIPSDGVVVVDGRGFDGLGLSFIDPSFHAITWFGDSGEIQVKDVAGMIVENRPISTYSEFQPALDAWEVERAKADAPPTLEARRQVRWEQVKAERSRREYGGVRASGHWFQTDAESQIKLLRLDQKADAVLAAGGDVADVLTILGQPVAWKTYDNGVVPMTAGLAKEIAMAIEVQSALAYVRGQALYAEIMASESPESIDITTGWPAIYEVQP